MKLIHCCLLLAPLWFANPLLAQTRGTVLGFRGGVSVASVSLDTDTFDPDNRTGFVGGVFLDSSGGGLGFQIAAVYHAAGFESDEFELGLDYLEIPAVIKLGIPIAVLQPSVFGGVALGFEAGCEVNGVDCDDDDVKSTNFSGVVGADVVLDMGGVSLWVDGRYNFGLSDLNDAGDVFSDIKHRAWNLTAGLGFPLGR